jgi:hypothetical protein
MAIPYASATTGEKAQAEIKKILRRLGCQDIGFMEEDDTHALVLVFKHRGRPFQYRAPAKGWAALYLRENPWTHRHRKSQVEHEQAALRQGYVAAHSVVRDWVKAQITVIECGFAKFETMFMPYMLTSDGRTVNERVEELGLLPPPESPKVVPLPALGPNTMPR